MGFFWALRVWGEKKKIVMKLKATKNIEDFRMFLLLSKENLLKIHPLLFPSLLSILNFHFCNFFYTYATDLSILFSCPDWEISI